MVGARITSFLKEHGWLLNLAFIFIGSYFVAGAANAVVASGIREAPSIEEAPVRPNGNRERISKPRADFSNIAERNLLDAKREVLKPQDEQTIETMASNTYNPNDLKPCTMPHEIRATLLAEGAPEWSLAVIYDSTEREPNVFSINEGYNRIGEDMVLFEVRDRAIVLKRRDHYELCVTDGDAKAPGVAAPPEVKEEGEGGEGGEGVTKVSDSQFTVARSEVDNALSNLSQVATQARIVPSFKNGKPNGFKLFSIKPGSIYSKIGLKNGDVIQKINGYEMNSPDKALEIYQKLKDASSVTIDLQRRGQNQNLSYTIQ